MPTLQDRYDDAMYEFSTENYSAAISSLQSLLKEDHSYFDAQLSLGMVHYRMGNFALAIEEGHKAEGMRPKDPLVHTNLSLFYMKNGDKTTAEHHGLQARIASWRTPESPAPLDGTASELDMAKPPVAAAKPPSKFPDMPWKKNLPVNRPSSAE